MDCTFRPDGTDAEAERPEVDMTFDPDRKPEQASEPAKATGKAPAKA